MFFINHMYSIMEQDERTKEFIRKARELHGNKYDYSKSDYKKVGQKVIIICKEHGEFLSLTNNHLRNHGCRLCANNHLSKSKTIGLDGFIARAKTKHRDNYDYSKFIYKNCKSIGIIICPIHGDFSQSAESHYLGSGCKRCSATKQNEKFKRTTEEFIKEAIEKHGDLYDYSKVDYSSTHQAVIIICRIHGDFSQRASSHIKGAGCFYCGIIRSRDSKRYTTETYIESAKEKHGDLYDYSKVEYLSNRSKIIIICKTHGEFLQTATQHLSGSGCPICVNKTECKLYEKMKYLYPSLLTQLKQDWCKKIRYLPYDFCIPEYKIIIELDGRQHFIPVKKWETNPEEQFENDKYKEECANQNGYSVIRLLQEDVFYDTYDWVKELCDAIEEVKSSEGITNVYLCKNDEYDQF